MDQSSSGEANSHLACQEISRLLWKPEVYYHLHKEPATDPCTEPDISSSHRLILFPTIHYNIILPSTLKSSRIASSFQDFKPKY